MAVESLIMLSRSPAITFSSLPNLDYINTDDGEVIQTTNSLLLSTVLVDFCSTCYIKQPILYSYMLLITALFGYTARNSAKAFLVGVSINPRPPWAVTALH